MFIWTYLIVTETHTELSAAIQKMIISTGHITPVLFRAKELLDLAHRIYFRTLTFDFWN